MSRKPYRVGRAKTGLGLFAAKPIKKRTIIIEYSGPRITNAEADALEAKGAKYMYELNSRWTVDGATRRNIGRYANHSCRPNAESDVLRGPRAGGRKGGKVILRAIRHIKPGDEITYDYGKPYFNAYIKPFGCKCPKCTEKRREERSAKLRATRRRKLREAKQRRELRASRKK